MEPQSLRDLLEPFGPVTVRKMFGGLAAYADDLCIAWVIRGEVMVRGDAETALLFEAAGCQQFLYQSKGGKSVAMPYWRLPETAHDDADELRHWCNLALSAARRQARTKPAKTPKRPKLTAKSKTGQV